MNRIIEICFIILIVMTVGYSVSRGADDSSEARAGINLRAALEEREQRIQNYEQLEVMRCATGDLKLNIDDSAAAGEPIFDYTLVSGCKYMVLPEPNFVVGLVACGTLLLVLRKGTP